jgi:hypothetical protein
LFNKIIKWFRNSTALEKAAVITAIAGIAIALIAIETQDIDFLTFLKPDGIPVHDFNRKNLETTINKSEQVFEVIQYKSGEPDNVRSGTIYYFDVESGQDEWNISGLWHVTTRRYNSSGHSFLYGSETTGKYDTEKNSGGLISPEISLVNTGRPVLYFMSRYQAGSDNKDTKFVQISEDKHQWKNLKQIVHAQNIWVREEIDLSDYAGEKIRIRFFFDTVDNQSNMDEGWYIDDIEIKGG